jgi:hypothetical protein
VGARAILDLDMTSPGFGWTTAPRRSRRPTRATRLACAALLTAAFGAAGCSTWGGFADPHPGQVRERPEIALGDDSLKLHLVRPAGEASPRVLLFHVTGDSGWHGLDPLYFDTLASHGHTLAGASARGIRARLGSLGSDATPARLADEYVRLIGIAEQRLHLAPGTPVVITGLSRGAGLAVVAASQPALARRIAGVLLMGLTADENNVRPTAFPFELLPRIDRPLVLLQSTQDRHVAAVKARQLFGPDVPGRKMVVIEANGHTFGGNRDELFRQVESGLDWIVQKGK